MRELVKAFDAYALSGGNHSVDLNFSAFEKYSIQAVWSGVTGTNNGTIKVLQSNDQAGTPVFDQLKTINSAGAEVDFGITMSGTSGSATIEDKAGFTGQKMRITLAVGTITGGTLNVYVNKIYA